MSPELYLSRFRVAADAVVNPYEAHRLLWKAFPGTPDASRPYLFRLFEGRGGLSREALMLSSRRPSRPEDPRAALLESRSFVPKLQAGSRLRFELQANPVKRLAKSGDRVPLIRDEERTSWLVRQLTGSAEIEESRVTAFQPLYFRKPGMRPGKVEAVIFNGLLRVKSPERLLEKCRDGIGPAKSFGCGLLLLAGA